MAKKLTLNCNGKKLVIVPAEIVMDRHVEKSPQIAPGHGEFEISEPVFETNVNENSKKVRFKVAVNGKNIAQISSVVFLQTGKTLIGPLVQEFVQSPADREVKGILHPRWMVENEIDITVSPTIKLLFCGEGFSLACMKPERYGVAAEDQIWSLEGIYQRGGGEPFRAKLEFNNQGDLIKKTGFYPVSSVGLVSPFELFIEDGDTFEPYVTLINGKGVESLGTVNPVMLGGGGLPIWVQAETPEGLYHAGILVEDFDGKVTIKVAAVK